MKKMVNGEMVDMTAEEIAARQAEEAENEAKKATVQQIKDEAGRRIQEIFPDWKQRNMVALGVTLVEAKLVGPLSAELQAQERQLKAAWAWVGAVRAASGVMELDPPKRAELSSDPRWPKPLGD